MQTITPNDRLLAIRSLQSKHHAENLPPKIVKVVWNIGKRCNYDCSYCTPHIHDAVSDHIKIDDVEKVVRNIDIEMKRVGKKSHFSITGGEPFLHPGFKSILQSISQCETVDASNLTVVTNGSLPLRVMEPCMPFITNLTTSMHLERSPREVSTVVNNLISLKQKWSDRFFAANLMFLPGHLDQILEIRDRLMIHGINVAIRRIRPNTDGLMQNTDLIMPMTRRRSKELADQDISIQANLKTRYKAFQDQYLIEWYKKYYSPEELQVLTEEDKKANYANMAIWKSDNTYEEINSDDILSNDLSNFHDWACFAGTDSIYINFDGSVYNGNCLTHKIGSITDGIQWPTGPLTCTRYNCTSNADVIVRKSRYENLDLIQPN